MHYRYGQTATKNGIWSLSTVRIKEKKQSTFTVVGLNDNREVYV